jgi:hypothetical protein
MTLNQLLQHVPEADRDLPLCISRTLGTAEVIHVSIEEGEEGAFSLPDGRIAETWRHVVLHGH